MKGEVEMLSTEHGLIQQMVDTIVREADPDTVILFGSRARGDAGGRTLISIC